MFGGANCGDLCALLYTVIVYHGNEKMSKELGHSH